MRFNNASAPGFENTWLARYRRAIDSGRVIAGMELKRGLENVVTELGEGGTYYDTEKADACIDFIENCTRLTKSDFYGKPFRLLLWQKAFIEVFYSVKLADGHDRYQQILLLIARKNGKSSVASALCLYEMIMGRGLDICCSSNDDKQSDILYREVEAMRRIIDPGSIDTKKATSYIECMATSSKVFKISDTTRRKEGYNIDVAVIDEIHELKDNTSVKPIEQSQSAKENPKIIFITTEGFTNGGYLDGLLVRARDILNGRGTGAADYRFLPWLYTQDEEAEIWNGTRENRFWEKSNPSLGAIKKWEALEADVDLAKRSQADRVFCMAKNFNIKQGNSSGWLKLEDYSYTAENYTLENFRNTSCIASVDLAETTDLACIRLGFFLQSGRIFVYSHYFAPEAKKNRSADVSAGAKYEDWENMGLIDFLPGEYLDERAVADWLYEVVYKQYNITPILTGYDARFAPVFLEEMKEIGLPVMQIPQRPEILHPSICMTEADLKGHNIIGLNDIDKWCLGNAALVVNSSGLGMLVKIRGNATRRIDGAITLVMLYNTYRQAQTAEYGYEKTEDPNGNI